MVFELLFEGLAIGLIIWRYKQHPQIIAFPPQNRWQQYCWGFMIGLFWFTIVWLIAVQNKGFIVKYIFNWNNSGWFCLFLMGFMVQSMFEELLCCGYVMGRLLEANLPKTAIWVNSLLFMMLHMANAGFNWLPACGLLFFALAMSIIRLKTQSLWFVGAFHAAWNFAEGVIFGSSVSGEETVAIIFHSVPLPAKPLINGGEFGIEGSLISVLLDGLLLLLVSLYFYIKPSIKVKGI